jgi:DNA-directed RNA polymerase specialized sigma24 family protein
MLNEQRRYVVARGLTETAKMARHEEGRRMAAHLATRTSLRKNRTLARALDEIRDYNGPHGRLSALLRELYIEGPQAWDAQRDASERLLSTRTAAAKKIVERLDSETSDEVKLAMFAEREAWIKRARSAGLTPREHELFRLVVSDPTRFLRNGKLNHKEAAREMGVAVGTIKSLWSRTRKTLKAS